MGYFPRSSGGGAPSGPAGGDLSGTYPNPGVAKVDGIAVTGTPSSGQVLTATSGTAADWATPSAGALSTASGSLAANVTFDALTTLLTTASLAAGTWLVNVSLTVQIPSTATNGFEIEGVAGTASATITGASTQGDTLGVVTGVDSVAVNVPASLTFLAVVTSPGTLLIRGQVDGDGVNYTALAASGSNFTGHTASGYTAVKIA